MSAESEGAYMPNKASREILELAYRFVQSVPYKVTARWLFYRLLQVGVYSHKDDYKCRFLPLATRARKAFYGGWAPDTLTDDTRAATLLGFGYGDALDWLQGEVYRQGCKLDKWASQAYYLELWFEAAAMRSQFAYYTRNVPIRPFQGDPSLPFKWDTAKHLERIGQMYPGKPILVLYFGDLDPKGLQIPESALADIQAWCAVPLRLWRCGLNPGDEVRFSLPENFDKPGTYQWEALGDEDARRLITENIARYIDEEAIAAVEAREQEITMRFRTEVANMAERWGTP